MAIEHLQYHPEKTQIIFFDLEFYVPKEDREGRKELKANPYKAGHFLIGGTFTKYFPLLSINDERNITKEFWIWNYENDEKMMLSEILNFIEESWRLIYQSNNQAELFYSGIGIQRADIQYLFARSKIHNLRTESELFDIFYKGRFLDFETILIPFFNNKGNMLKTKSTGEIISKFNIPTERKPSSSVWEQYDTNEFEQIRERNIHEVSDLKTIYSKLITRIHFNSIHNKYSTEALERIKLVIKKDDFSFLQNCYLENEEGWFILRSKIKFSKKIKKQNLINDKKISTLALKNEVDK